MKFIFFAVLFAPLVSSCDFIDSILFRGTFEAVERCAERNTSSFVSLFEARNGCAQKHQYLVGNFLDHQISGSAGFINLTYSDEQFIQLSFHNNYEDILITQIEVSFLLEGVPNLVYFLVPNLWIEPNKADRRNISEREISQLIGQAEGSSIPHFSSWGVTNVWGIRAKKF